MSDTPTTTDGPADLPAEPPRPRGAAMLRGGLATMLVGAVLLGVAMVATTTSSPEATCPAGTTLLSRYDVVDGAYVAAGDTSVTLVGATPTGGAWNSTRPIGAVVVKGGPGSVSTALSPAATTGTFTNGELPPVDGATPEIAYVQFCTPTLAAVAGPTTTTTAPPTYSVTLAARTCPTYTDIRANKARNNIQESLENLGPDTNYTGGEVVNPVKEDAPPQSACSPLTGWNFQWGTGITGKSPSTANLSTVTGQNAIATTQASVPLLDANGNPTGNSIAGAVTYTLTGQQILDAASRKLWIQGGTKAAPLGAGTVSFGALRCATDNNNGDNVEFVQFPKDTRHVFCYAYYVAQPPEPVTIVIRKQLTERSPGGTTFTFGGDTSFIPGGSFTLTPPAAGGRADISFVRAADVNWTINEVVPDGWTLESLSCTTPTSGRTPTVSGASLTANLAPGDSTTCTFTNDKTPPPSTTTTTEPTTTTTEPTTTTTEPTTTTTEPTTTTTEPTTTTTESTTTVAPTSSTPGSTSTTPATTSTEPGEVESASVARATVTADDAAASGAGRVLAFTGGSALPLVVIGIALLLVGATLAAVSWQRRRSDATA